MSKTILFSVVLLLFVTCAFAADSEPVQSGLQPGETAGAFYVDDVTGPYQGKSLCYACTYGKSTVVNIQTRNITPQVIELLKQLDPKVDPADDKDSEAKHAFMVYITEDPETASEELREVAKECGLKNIPLTVHDGLTGPRGYKIGRYAETTVMMWSDTKVKFNHAFGRKQLDDAAVKRVMADAETHLK